LFIQPNYYYKVLTRSRSTWPSYV